VIKNYIKINILKFMTQKMKCDFCKVDEQNEVLVLRQNQFTEKGQDLKKLHRVCWTCGAYLQRNEYYNFGIHWRELMHDIEVLYR
jgi:hypothetical protein